MRRYVLLIAALAFVPQSNSAHAQLQPNTQRGAVAGGLAGAIAGAIIGENNDKAGPGALIGGAVGAIAGGAFGNAKDKDFQYRQQQYQMQSQQRYYAAEQQQLALQQRQLAATQSAVSMNDVISLSRSGVGDSVLINQIAQRGVQRQIEVSDIIQLHQNGVSEPVISAMQRAQIGSQIAAPAAVVVQEQVPVYVERQVEVRPTYVVPAPRYYRYPPQYHRHYRGW